MKTWSAFRILAVAGLCCAAVGVARASNAKLEPLGNDTYSATRQASTGFSRNTSVLRTEAMEDAEKFCASHGKQLKVVTVTEDRPFYTLGFATARVMFKALDAGNPELASEPPPPALAVTLEKAAPAGDLYSELLKLDDLRKRGILTDKEFEAEKKKVLRRSK